MADLTLITPTADQPIGMALCERYMVAQTAWSRVARWVVVDDGEEKASLSLGQEHVRREREPGCSGVQSFCSNLLAAVPFVETEYVAIIEHDDCYHERHLEFLLDWLSRPEVLLAGDDEQRYYHVGLRQWRVFDNWRGASLYTTGFRQQVLPLYERAAAQCLKHNAKGVDAFLWDEMEERHKRTYRVSQAVGIKGLPGRAGIGIGHRPQESGVEWNEDPDGEVLRAWCGAYAKEYKEHYEKEEENGETYAVSS